MTINGGMQDAVAGGKIALHSAFLNDLMEMPELSGDSIARTVDMALARIKDAADTKVLRMARGQKIPVKRVDFTFEVHR